MSVSVSELGEGTHSFQGYIYPDVTEGENLVNGSESSKSVTLCESVEFCPINIGVPMSYVSSYKFNGSLMSINLSFYPEMSGAGTLVSVIKPSDTVAFCEFAMTWSAQIAIHNGPVL